MKTGWAAAGMGFLLLAGGCAGPGVLGELPEPVFGAPRQEPPRPIEAPVVTPEPARLPPRPTGGDLGGFTIVVDAGHGGRDPGALGEGPACEKAINLGVAAKLAGLLRRSGATVVTTRDGDAFVDLDERADSADRYGADLLVSIHADAADSGSTSGATVYIARNGSPASRRAGQCVAAALKRAGIGCRGVRQAGFRVLVGHSRPAVLIECGFLTNHYEARLLSTGAYQAKIAAAIADGIADHLGR